MPDLTYYCKIHHKRPVRAKKCYPRKGGGCIHLCGMHGIDNLSAVVRLRHLAIHPLTECAKRDCRCAKEDQCQPSEG